MSHYRVLALLVTTLCLFTPVLHSQEVKSAIVDVKDAEKDRTAESDLIMPGYPGDVLRAGMVRIDITPTVSVDLAGYASRESPSTGVHDSLSARIVAFELDGHHLVLVSTDLLGFYGRTLDMVKEEIFEANPVLGPSELFLSSTHTHSAPRLMTDESEGNANNVEYTKSLGIQLAGAIREALEIKNPVRIGVGSGSSPIGVNRREKIVDEDGERIVLGRNPEAMTDREVQVVIVEPLGDGQSMTVMFTYAMHSTAQGPANKLISGDVHGLAAQFLEKHLGEGAIAPAFAGASGDIDPWYRVIPGFQYERGWVPETVLMSKMLGIEVIHINKNVKREESSGPIRTIANTLELPAKRQAGDDSPVVTDTRTLNLNIGRMGNIGFVCLGGEVLNQIGREIKTASPFPTTFIMTQCNGAAGYLPPGEIYEEGGYEVRSSRFAPDAANQVIAEVVRLLELLHGS